jgi:hypothetical protein
MSYQEEQRFLKQKFLRQQIIEMEYDAQEFCEYIGKKKEDGTSGLIQEPTSTTGLTMNLLQ